MGRRHCFLRLLLTGDFFSLRLSVASVSMAFLHLIVIINVLFFVLLSHFSLSIFLSITHLFYYLFQYMFALTLTYLRAFSRSNNEKQKKNTNVVCFDPKTHTHTKTRAFLKTLAFATTDIILSVRYKAII